MISDVPANATAIGIPARVVDSEKKKTSSFSPYAVSKDEDDPMLKTLQGLIAEVAEQKKQLDSLINKTTKPSTKK